MCRRFVLEPESSQELCYYRSYDPTRLLPTIILPTLKTWVIGLDKDNQLSTSIKSFGFDSLGDIIYNARYETITKKALFAPSFEKRRVVIPASGFYEPDKYQHDHYFFDKSGGLLYFAGIYEDDRFVILTCPADETVFFYHPRMPFCIEKKDIPLYLDTKNGTFLFDLLKHPELSSPDSSEQLSLF